MSTSNPRSPDSPPPASAGARLPVVYSCSGASSAAQMANHLAVRLDRLEVAEMSCIAGVGGDVRPLVRVATSGRPIVAIDGCPLRCVAQILKRHGVVAEHHYILTEHGVEKRAHEDFSAAQASTLLAAIRSDLAAAARPVEAGEVVGEVA